ncbi:hypothetical protein GYMLUDRAFT_263495 [Collybiopsis luxurians FD-317 M1]|uniref:DUF6534 domain-containing protein n=1 Tax=Collybiopsis luxurians FD-317 M1 TaxID=944289 RepID=A0A0D0B1D9_9AGAR|nr:hypothetical protein GYMLUDRAFT_263495 [Collybiopsis luxurians FD-317 M1]
MSLNSIIGTLEIANGLSTFFLGIITLQIYFFYRAFPEEKWQAKLAVAAVYAFELGHTISLSHTLYEMTIIDFGQPQRFVKLPDSIEVGLLFEATGLLTSIISVITVICYVTMPTNTVWILVYTLLAKSYSNSMLVALNARPAKISNDNVITLPTANAQHTSNTAFQKSQDVSTAINVSQVVVTTTDEILTSPKGQGQGDPRFN